MHEERLRPAAAASGVDSVPLTVEAMQQRGNLHHVTFLMDAQDRWCPARPVSRAIAGCFRAGQPLAEKAEGLSCCLAFHCDAKTATCSELDCVRTLHTGGHQRQGLVCLSQAMASPVSARRGECHGHDLLLLTQQRPPASGAGEAWPPEV